MLQELFWSKDGLLIRYDNPSSLQLTGAMQPLRPYEKQDTFRQFLDYDRQVLRFYCLWDDSDRYIVSYTSTSLTIARMSMSIGDISSLSQ